MNHLNRVEKNSYRYLLNKLYVKSDVLANIHQYQMNNECNVQAEQDKYNDGL